MPVTRSTNLTALNGKDARWRFERIAMQVPEEEVSAALVPVVVGLGPVVGASLATAAVIRGLHVVVVMAVAASTVVDTAAAAAVVVVASEATVITILGHLFLPMSLPTMLQAVVSAAKSSMSAMFVSMVSPSLCCMLTRI